MDGSDVPFIVHLMKLRGFVAPRYSTREEDWRDHSVFKTKLSDIKSVTMEIPADPGQSFEIMQDEDIHLKSLESGELVAKYDTMKMLNFLSAFADLRYEALMNKLDSAFIDSITSSLPFHIITLEETNGKVTAIKTFHKDNDAGRFDLEGNIYVNDLDRAYALVNDERDFVMIQFFVFDKILRPLSYFIPESAQQID